MLFIMFIKAKEFMKAKLFMNAKVFSKAKMFMEKKCSRFLPMVRVTHEVSEQVRFLLKKYS